MSGSPKRPAVRVEWRPRAHQDALGIAEHIEIDDPAAARATVEEVGRQVGLLADFPAMGRLGRVPGTRELVISRTPYIAVYRVEDDDVVAVLRVLHGARRWPEQ